MHMFGAHVNHLPMRPPGFTRSRGETRAATWYQRTTEASALSDEHGWRLGRIDPFGHEWEIGAPLGRWPPSWSRAAQT
jgi:hypothetical protein